jgi:hypothetical protein
LIDFFVVRSVAWTLPWTLLFDGRPDGGLFSVRVSVDKSRVSR